MSTIKDKIYFTYNGLNSRDFGLMSIETGSGMYEEQLVADRSIIETSTRNGKPLFNRIDEKPLSFSLNLAFEKKFDEFAINEIIDWLFQDYYKPLYFEGKEDRIYYCMPEGSSSIVHNGLMEGYATLIMRCDSSRLYSSEITTEQLSYNGITPVEKEIINIGHYDISARISIDKVGDGDVSITNNGDTFMITGLKNNESIYIDSDREIIESDIINTYRYNNIVGEFEYLTLKKGLNNIVISGGACIVQIKYTNRYKA